MKRYGMMGGTFNPIHLAHLYIAYEAKEALSLDKVIFMVAGNPPHKKDTKVIDAKYRYNMVQKAIESYEGFDISDYEIQKEGYSYTYETLKYLKGDKEDIEVYRETCGDYDTVLFEYDDEDKSEPYNSLCFYFRHNWSA